MEVPEGGPKMKKKRLFWVGSALAVGFLGLSTLSDWGGGNFSPGSRVWDRAVPEPLFE